MKRKLTATFAFLLLLASGGWAAETLLWNFSDDTQSQTKETH